MPVETIDLNGQWQLTDTDHGAGDAARLSTPDAGADWMDVAVPGDVHAALRAAGRIPAPFFGMNTEQCTWTGHRDWWYRREVEAPAEVAGRRLELVFDGIDTYADVYVDGKRVGETDNSFLQYRFDVTEHLRPGRKSVVVVRIKAIYPVIESRDTSKYFACFYTPRIFARKAQCQFSWDWAPHLPAMGIWEGVRLEAVEPGVVKDVYVQPRLNGETFVKAEVEGGVLRTAETPTADKVEFSIWLQGRRVASATLSLAGKANFANLTVPDPQLWWPNGYGDPNLYECRVRLKRQGKAIHEKTVRFGIREVELLEEPLDTDLHGFRFRVNGVDVFCQGANWVPADCFPGTIAADRYAHLVRLTKEARFNMLRVWGGGIYEKDMFYDLCDENGIMVWQDLMFACADIPDDDDDFVKAVIPEFQYQVRRLRNHPCIAHWCGGNEKTGTFGLRKSYGDTIARYVARGVVQDLAHGLAYTPSSPYSHTDVGNQPQSGDTHGGCYEVAFEDDIRRMRKHIDAKNTVFNSEFGAHGPCQMRSLRKFMPEDKLWPLNEVWEAHVQDNPYNSLEETFVQVQEACATRLFHAPGSAADFVKVAGTFHAEILREEFEHHRRRWPVNTGGLVWMLNDTWPCASWSIIDYYGVPKQVYYALKRACRPVLPSFRAVPGGVEFHVTSSLLKPLRGTARIELLTVDGERTTLWKDRFSVGKHGSKRVAALKNSEIPGTGNSCIVGSVRHGRQESAITWFHRLWHDIDWPDPGLNVTTGEAERRDGEYIAQVTLKAKRYGRCVNLRTREDILAYWSDNFFDMTPGETRTVEVASREPFVPGEIVVNHWLTTWD